MYIRWLMEASKHSSQMDSLSSRWILLMSSCLRTDVTKDYEVMQKDVVTNQPSRILALKYDQPAFETALENLET